MIAVPLTTETVRLFDRAAFAAMNPAAQLINTGRGDIAQTRALVETLDAGVIAGAALDVFETDPLPAAHPLWTRNNVLISAHMAGDFMGWRETLSQQFLDHFALWQNGQTLHSMVNKTLGYETPEPSPGNCAHESRTRNAK